MGYATDRFAKRLKQLRETAGLTQEQFARELKVSRGAISYYEKGDRTPDIEFLDSLYDYFCCTLPIDFLLGYTNNVKEEHRDMYDFYGLTDKACDELESDTEIGHLISAIIGHENFYGIKRTYEGIIRNYKTFDYRELGYAGFLISSSLNKIVFDSIAILKNIQYTPEERDALGIKMEISHNEFEKEIKEWDERDKLLKEKWEKEEVELMKLEKEENATRYAAIDKVREKFYETVEFTEYQRNHL
ncbi:MAG: helix-turn-helix transcriptional regulator [Paenibacillaceae bacterium]|nr:helix-turn-helix transcriptional regulator [Paenibacillaceae bacterium]